MTTVTRPNYYLYIAGIKIPLQGFTVGSGYNTLATLNLQVAYSPFITRLKLFTKIQILKWIDTEEPLLEFDGVLVGISKYRNILGQVSCSISCLTDGAIWNKILVYDYTFENFESTLVEGNEGTLLYESADYEIDNRLYSFVRQAKYDIGKAVSLILCSQLEVDKKSTIKGASSFYNGKEVVVGDLPKPINPTTRKYYKRFLDDFHLQLKLSGVETSGTLQKFLSTQQNVEFLYNTMQNFNTSSTLWQSIFTVLSLTFYEIYDIANPTYINNVLAEYIVKPQTIFGTPVKCNVVWPDQILTEDYFDNMFANISRVRYIANPLESNDNSSILTSNVIVAPNFKSTGFFQSYTFPSITSEKQRLQSKISDYEKEYGITSFQFGMGRTFDEIFFYTDAVKTDSDEERKKFLEKNKKVITTRLNKYINYQYAVQYFANRQYSIQLDPSVELTPGLPVVILNNSGDHVIGYCMSFQKSWDSQGQTNVVAQIINPYLYYEDMSDIAKEIDPITADKAASDQLCNLLGTLPIHDGSFGDFAATATAVEKLYNSYLEDANAETTKKEYRRKVCTYRQFLAFYATSIADFKTGSYFDPTFNDIPTEMPDEYPGDLSSLFDSTPEMNKMSSNVFRVYDRITKKAQEFKGLSNKELVKHHLEFVSIARRI